MTTQITCPACKASLKLAKAIAPGKLIRCPKCTKTVRVPEEPEEADEELEPAPPPAKKGIASKKPVRPPVEEEDEELEEAPARPAKKSVGKKPLRNRDDDEDDEEPEDRPRKGRKKKKSQEEEGKSGLVRNIIGGVTLLILLVVVVIVFVSRWSDIFPSESTKKSETTKAKVITPKVIFKKDGDAIKKISINPKGKKGNEPEPLGPPIAITDLKLAEEYFADPKGTAAKYANKLLDVTGVVTQTTNFTSTPQVLLRTDLDPVKGFQKKLVFVFNEQQEDTVNRLWKEQTVTIRGKLSTGSLSKNFALVLNCQLIEKGPFIPVVIDASQITKEFAATPEEAAKKYNGKPLIVQGMVANIKRDEGSYIFQLKGFDKEGKSIPVEIICFPGLQVAQKKHYQAIQVGQNLRFKGYAILLPGDDLVSMHEGVVLNKQGD